MISYFRKTEHADPLNRLLYVDAKTFLLDDNLAKVDRMTMANSLEARVPLLDHELVERVARDTSADQIQRAPDKTALAKSCPESLAAQDSQGEEEGIHSSPTLLDQARTQRIPWRILRPGETESYRHVKRKPLPPVARRAPPGEKGQQQADLDDLGTRLLVGKVRELI